MRNIFTEVIFSKVDTDNDFCRNPFSKVDTMIQGLVPCGARAFGMQNFGDYGNSRFFDGNM